MIFSVSYGHVGLGIAGPGDAQLPHAACDLLHARTEVGEGIVVEEDFLDLRQVVADPLNLVEHVLHAAHAVAMPADGLGPQAEGALGAATPAGVQRHVRMFEVADEVVLDLQVALVHRRHPRQLIHVGQQRPRGVVLDAPFAVLKAQAGDAVQRASLGHFLAGEVEFLARDEIDRGGGGERAGRVDCNLGSDHADQQVRILRLHQLRRVGVRRKRRRAGVHDHQLILSRQRHNVLQRQAVGGRIDELAVRDHRGRLREPGGIPERADLAFGLVA